MAKGRAYKICLILSVGNRLHASSATQPPPHFPRMVVTRNQNRARRRYRQACSLASNPDLVARGDGKLDLEPSDDEDLPMEIPRATLSSPTYFAFPLGSLGPCLTVRIDPSTLPPPRTKRPVKPLDTSPTKEQRTSKNKEASESEENLADSGPPTGNDDHIAFAVTHENRANASGKPTLGMGGI